MSLDISLNLKGAAVVKESSGIFVREGGQTKEISIEEWNKRNPGREPVKLVPQEVESDEVFSANITHNLTDMAEEAGIYKHLWRPEELEITKAKELIDPLREGLHKLKIEPEKYKKLNPENGWGTYNGLVNFVEDYLGACYRYPEADIKVSR